MDDIDLYLLEDLDEDGDITSQALFTDETAEASILVKEPCILAGIDEVKKVFEKTGAHCTTHYQDGNQVEPQSTIATITGSLLGILSGERLALNILGRMSGIATQTYHIVTKCHEINPNVRIAATRKTTPGFRKYEKKAVEIGGGESHRFGLYDAVLIKDNHIKYIGSIKQTITQMTEKIKNKTIEVEVKNEADALTAAQMPIHWIMLDNFTPKKAARLTSKIKNINQAILIEVSGGINPDTSQLYASFADRISLGFLTHTIQNIDFSLNLN